MAVKEAPTYGFIPPPPLPEFYTVKKKLQEGHAQSVSSSVEAEETQVLVSRTKTVQFTEPCGGDDEKQITKMNVTYDASQQAAPQPAATPMMVMTVPLPGVDGANVPPLAIYHICRICMRPRSRRYHLRHPIPIDGVPPPPGICRRCRVTTVEEVDTAEEVVVKSSSNKIKLGLLQPFLPDEVIISNEEVRRMQMDGLIEARLEKGRRSRRRSRSYPDIVYRHIRVVEESEEDSGLFRPSRHKKVVRITREVDEDFDEDSPPRRHSPRRVKSKRIAQAPLIERRASPPKDKVETAAFASVNDQRASVAARASSVSSQSGSQSLVKATTAVSTGDPGRADSEIRMIAREEFERYRTPQNQEYTESEIRNLARQEIESHNKAQKPSRDDSKIRKLAREEVRRYREAERKLDAHPEAYAHGRLVPVERRISVERDIEVPKPWKESERKATVQVSSLEKVQAAKTASHTETVRVAAATVERELEQPTSTAPQPSRRSSWDIRTVDERKELREGSSKEGSQKGRPSDSKDETTRGNGARSGVTSWSPKARYDEVGTTYEPSIHERDVVETDWEAKVSSQRSAASPKQSQDDRSSARKDPSISDRRKRVEVDVTREALRREALPSTHWSFDDYPGMWSGTSRPTDQDYWCDQRTVQTLDSRSSKRYETSGSGGTPGGRSQQPTVRTLQSEASSAPKRVDIIRSEALSGKSSSNADRDQNRRSQVSRTSSRPQDNPPPGYRIVYPGDPSDSSAAPSPVKSRHSRPDPDVEYEYVVRTVQPSDRPPGSAPWDDPAGVRHASHFEHVELERHPEQSAREQPPPPHRERRQRRRPRVASIDGGSHVHFSNKVEISPTPPGSDASSSAFRSFHSFGRGHGRQIDGHLSSDRGEELAAAEYEQRGRSRSRDAWPRHDYGYERRVVRERQAEGSQGTKQTGRGESSRSKETARSSQRGGKSRPSYPLSESPSREESLTGSYRGDGDGAGPYRAEERITESMRVESGSGSGRYRVGPGELVVPPRGDERRW